MFKVLLINVNHFYLPVEHIGLVSLAAFLRQNEIDVTILNMDANHDMTFGRTRIVLGYPDV